MSLWQYANPVKFLALSERVQPVLWVLAAVFVSVGLLWGFFCTPDDARQGSTVKIIYLHVPIYSVGQYADFEHPNGAVPVTAKMTCIDVEIVMPFVDVGVGGENTE